MRLSSAGRVGDSFGGRHAFPGVTEAPTHQGAKGVIVFEFMGEEVCVHVTEDDDPVSLGINLAPGPVAPQFQHGIESIIEIPLASLGVGRSEITFGVAVVEDEIEATYAEGGNEPASGRSPTRHGTEINFLAKKPGKSRHQPGLLLHFALVEPGSVFFPVMGRCEEGKEPVHPIIKRNEGAEIAGFLGGNDVRIDAEKRGGDRFNVALHVRLGRSPLSGRKPLDVPAYQAQKRSFCRGCNAVNRERDGRFHPRRRGQSLLSVQGMAAEEDGAQ